METVRRIAAWLLVALVTLAAAMVAGGLVYQSAAQSADLQQWPAPGRLVDVDGDLMHLYCQGSGSPVVVLEQGNGGYYDQWYDLSRELSTLTQVCSYDRAGMGYSEALGRAVSSDEVAARLHKLLAAAAINDELILVGWSAGGIHVRNFHRQFPDKVAGMILIDSSHEQQQSRMFDPTPSGGIDTRKFAAYLGPIGLIRLSGQIDAAVDFGPGSSEHKQRTKAIQKQSHWALAYFREFDAFDTDQVLNRTPSSLGALPLTVLTRGREVQQGGMPSYYTLEILQEREREWQALQKELVSLSTRGRQVIASESGHSIHLDQPDLVVAAVEEMLLHVRSGQVDAE